MNGIQRIKKKIAGPIGILPKSFVIFGLRGKFYLSAIYPRGILSQMYISFIKPQFECAVQVWFRCTNVDIEKLEKV